MCILLVFSVLVVGGRLLFIKHGSIGWSGVCKSRTVYAISTPPEDRRASVTVDSPRPSEPATARPLATTTLRLVSGAFGGKSLAFLHFQVLAFIFIIDSRKCAIKIDIMPTSLQ